MALSDAWQHSRERENDSISEQAAGLNFGEFCGVGRGFTAAALLFKKWELFANHVLGFF